MLRTRTTTTPPALGPVAQLRAGRLPARFAWLMVGLTAYGITLALIIRAGLGNASWDVLHQGVARLLPLSIGQVIVVVSVLVLLLWVPLRQAPGVGTVLNSLWVGVVADATLAVLPAPDELPVRVVLLLLGVVGNAAATAMYLGAHLGAGPRDGLMTGLHRRTGLSVRLVRTVVEVTVVAVGVLLGGVFGVGTVLYALAVGPLVQLFLPHLTLRLPGPRAGRPARRTDQPPSLNEG